MCLKHHTNLRHTEWNKAMLSYLPRQSSSFREETLIPEVTWKSHDPYCFWKSVIFIFILMNRHINENVVISFATFNMYFLLTLVIFSLIDTILSYDNLFPRYLHTTRIEAIL